MKNILVTGASGQLGNELQVLMEAYTDFQYFFTTRENLDLSNTQSIKDFFNKNKIDFCINAGAYTAVDKAESEAEMAWQINALAVQTLAECCREHNAVFFHISTDYVYHAGQGLAFTEEDPTAPAGEYARTKLEGEQLALVSNPNSIIFRTSWLYSSFGHNFVKTMMRLGRERDELNVVADQVGTPTYAADLAAVLMDLTQKINKGEISMYEIGGIYNYSNEGVASWYDFALAIFELKNIQCEVNPIETHEFPTPAQRPPFSLMNKRKIKETFNMKIPHWRDGLKRCLELL